MPAPVLETKYVFSLAIQVGAPIVAGDLGHGIHRIVPILGVRALLFAR